MKKLVFASVVALWTLLVVGCSDPSDPPLFPEEEISETMELKLSGWKVDSLDKEKLLIRVSPTKGWVDSLVIDSLSLPGSSALYLAADDDLIDPKLGEKFVPGTVVSTADTNQVSIVALDSYNRVMGVWLVIWDLPKKDSSSSSVGESSDSTGTSSSGTAETSEGSSSVSEGGSSAGAADSSADGGSSSDSGSSGSGNSSATGTESAGSSTDSGSSAESGSSTNSGSSSSEGVSGVKLSDLSVSSGTVTVTGTKVYVEVPYGTDLSSITLSPLNGTKDLRRPIEMQFLDAENNLGTYSVVAGVQLPGSDFSARDDFWATTSDAMAKAGSGKWLAVFTVDMTSTANMDFSDGKMTIDSRVVTGTSIAGIIDGGWKLAGGFYYTGSFSGSDCASIYQAENNSAGTDNADFSVYMSHGIPFSARPTSFIVNYSYSHVAGQNANYPQKNLIYVMLVSADSKVVATGAIMDEATVESSEKEVTLSYGADPFSLLTGVYPVAAGLELGTGDEDVASIHVMFASSAYAHVAAGGTLGLEKKNYRGGENSSLTLDNFKLIY